MYLYHELPLLVYPHIASPRPVTMDNQGMLICPFPDNPTFGLKLPDYLWGNRTGYCPHSFEWVYDKELGEMRQQINPYQDRTNLQIIFLFHHRSSFHEASVSPKQSPKTWDSTPSFPRQWSDRICSLSHFQKHFHFETLTKKGRTQCRRLPALCGIWGRVVFKPQTLPTQMCRGWGSNPGPSSYRR